MNKLKPYQLRKWMLLKWIKPFWPLIALGYMVAFPFIWLINVIKEEGDVLLGAYIDAFKLMIFYVEGSDDDQ